MDFILCILQYLLIAAVLVGIAAVAVFLGIKMRKASDAKKALEEAEDAEEE